MRRQARTSIGGALVVRTASALQVWLWMLIFVFQNEFRIGQSIQPGYLDFDNLPDTNFTCEGKVIGGYYADLETSCQMFHVCTVGQQDESMDIKFLCLNGTVFDQETRVCERVDEVDCTKSEKFYSLNLELYGSTAPPIIKPDQPKPQTTTTEKQYRKPSTEEDDADPSLDEDTSRSTNKNEGISSDVPDTTEDPVQDFNYEQPQRTPLIQQNNHSQKGDHEEPVEVNHEEEEEDNESPDYEEYNKTPTTTTQIPTTTKPQTTTIASTTSPQPSPISISISSPNPTYSSLSSPPQTPSASSHVVPTLDPALLSPQEFIYQHRGPGSEAISFQRQSFRPDSVYITHAPPQQQQFDHFQYESSRTAPRPGAPPSRPVAFAQRPVPTPFRVTTSDPRDQLSRPGPSSQSSERHEMSIKHRHQMYLPPLLAQRPLPFDPYYYDRKRSDDLSEENESSLSARSVAPPNVTDRPQAKPKSPPRVIVTASASVSDSNGKRLNYTVGNVVSAVKPIVPINYDNYKESDLIFDPFFLDVPKLEKRRKTRSKINQKVFSIPATATISSDLESIVKTTTSKVTSQVTTTESASTTHNITTTTHSWNPNDYVDDNYEPHIYNQPGPPLAIMLSYERNKNKDHEGQTINGLNKDKIYQKSIIGRIEESKPVSPPLVQSTSSQYVAAVLSASRTPLMPAEVACNNSDCRTRA